MGKTVFRNSTEQERKFFEGFESNINQSDKFQDFIKYGFFHFTPAENLKQSREGVLGEGIEDKGIKADIGKNSEKFEDKKRAYYAIGAEGAIGIINRAVYLSMVKYIEEQKIPPEQAKQMAYERVMQTLDGAVYLKMNIDDGIEYDSNDFMTLRNSHTIPNVKIPPEKLELLTVNDSTNGLDVFQFFHENCHSAQIRLGEGEENYIEEFSEYIKENSMEKNAKTVSSSLKKLDLAEKKKEYEEASLTFDSKVIEEFSRSLLNEGLRTTVLDEIGKETVLNYKNKDMNLDLDEQDK